jgi:bifunctional N-acetylglucosamine-1-phosphate-uridyltransferase/glucosamine-1-phosphate-acetyltransferase GlmU-like protein
MITAVVPAAGKGERLGAAVPKALVHLSTRPFLFYVLDAISPNVDALVLVVAPGKEQLFIDALIQYGWQKSYSIVVQDLPQGSADAVQTGLQPLDRRSIAVVAWADQVGLSATTVQEVVGVANDASHRLALPLVQVERPYVWFEGNEDSLTVKRQRDGDIAPQYGFNDVGCFGFQVETGMDAINALSRQDNQGREVDFVYALPLMAAKSGWTQINVEDPIEAIGINTPEELVRAAKEFEARRR